MLNDVRVLAVTDDLLSEMSPSNHSEEAIRVYVEVVTVMKLRP